MDSVRMASIYVLEEKKCFAFLCQLTRLISQVLRHKSLARALMSMSHPGM